MRCFRLTDVLCLIALSTLIAVATPRAQAEEAAPAEPLFAPPHVAVAPAASETHPAEASPSDHIDSPSHELWLISSRGVQGCQPCLDHPILQVQKLECGQGWRDSSLEEFLATGDPMVPTAFWIHGNDVACAQAAEQGHNVFHTITDSACRRVRMVIWSWPSDYIPGGVKNDAIVKYLRTDAEPFYLGEVIDRIRPDVPVVLVGYSFGARISIGTLHVLGGGSINSRSLPLTAAATPRVPRRAVLLAAAVGRDSLAPEHRYSEALSQVDHMVIMVNPQDRVLKFFPVLADDGDKAMGLSGPAGLEASQACRGRVVLFNVNPYVHKHHLSIEYQRSLEIMACVREEITTAGATISPPEHSTSKVTIHEPADGVNVAVRAK